MTSGTEPRTYRVLDVLGRGAFGTVYRAELTGSAGFTKEVALKVLNPDVESSPQHLARLRDEARMLGLVRHRAIVGVDDLVKLNDRWTVVMEYVAGVTLRELLDVYGPLPPATALAVAEEIGEALWAAYTALDRDGKPLKLLHRDVKPSNVQLTRQGDVKLLDFGIARAELPHREASTRSMVVGSVPYMAPERMDLQDSHGADVYSLGFTVVQLVTGRLPAAPTGSAENHRERTEETATLLRGAQVPEGLVTLIGRAIAWKPSERPDAHRFARECRALRASWPTEPLPEWAERHVGGILGGRRSVAGEFTGMVLEATTEHHKHLAELLGAAVPATFDDPRSEESQSPAQSTSSTTLDPPATPPPKPRGRTAWRLLGALVLFGTGLSLGAVVVGVLLIGGTAVLGTALVAAFFGSEAGCASSVDNTRTELARSRPEGRKKLGPLLDRAQAACQAGTLGSWGAIQVSIEIDHARADGVISDEDVTGVDRVLKANGG